MEAEKNRPDAKKQAYPVVRPEMLKRVDAETSLPWRQARDAETSSA
ncbi:MAG: hypothetical protein MUO85_05720 [candidate division Zixibacteria bacterium]|nr:hypothetical protein [candidate division Zixibacteria bacterium]